MIDNLISICSSLTYVITLLLLITFLVIPGSSIVIYSFIIPNFLLNIELYKLAVKFIYASLFYLALTSILLILLIIVVRLSFENYSIFYNLKNKHYIESYHTIKLLKHIIYSLLCLLIAIFINWYYDLLLIEIPLSVYICWVLGFVSSIPIKKTIHYKFNNNENIDERNSRIKDYLFIKAVSNMTCFYISYMGIRFYFF